MPTFSSLREQRIGSQRQWLANRQASERISAALRTGMIPWKNPIRNDDNAGLPLNFANGKPFTPISTLLLQVASHQHDSVGRWWGTQQDWDRLGGNIDLSREPTIVFDGEWHSVEVYCVDQVTGADVDQLHVHDHTIVVSDCADFSKIETLVELSGADIRVGVGDANHGAGDWYVPPNPWIAYPHHSRGDYILLQRPEFRSIMASHYYTLLHEFIHWAEVRTKWISDLYEREFVAEIGSGWLASELGCPPCRCRSNENKWLERWLWEIDRDSGFVFHAAEQARMAFQFIMSIIEGEQRC
ncbi:ArdC-like ssDNA-binding domain-containing protein [Rosistilla oblonga]|uniref:ArdC-like ssDNA-binding domain-containing protein n=1 Tax=Rosistilla oblonga TaxID=2527990 RepID=UPI0018D2524F|nr:ArdC-like ssDNA-binding domain-containing protein [Rosistilla oblonga]